MPAATERGTEAHHYHVGESRGMRDTNGHGVHKHHRVSPPMTRAEADTYRQTHPEHFEPEGPYRYTTTTECWARDCPAEWQDER